MPLVRVVETKDDLASPVIWLAADQFVSADAVRRTLAHEVAAHMTVGELLGPEFASISDALAAEQTDPRYWRLASFAECRQPGADAVAFAEHLIVVMAQRRTELPAMTWAIKAVRRRFRALGFRLAFSYEEVMGMIERAAAKNGGCP